MVRIAEKLMLLAGALLVLAACGGAGPPHSSYFVVDFLPSTPTASAAGVTALGNAVDTASSKTPSYIVVDAAEPPGDAEPAIEKARADAVVAAFIRAGIDKKRISVELRPVSNQGYQERKDSVIVQLGYGARPQP
jgi:ABC-type glycerol-3-phosphate transport system substrate-binding protein